MYSDTAGLSYEDPEIPAGTAHHQGADLNRVVSYPEAPESAETTGYAAAEPGTASAGDHAGPHETTAVLDPLPAGIDELLNSASLDDAAPLGDGAAPDGSPFPSDSAFPNDSAFPSDSAYFDDSASFDDSPFPLDPATAAGTRTRRRRARPAGGARRPQVNPRIASAPRPVEEESPAETTRPLGAISGEGTGAVPAGGGQPGGSGSWSSSPTRG